MTLTTSTHLTTNQNSFLAVTETTPHVDEVSTPTQNEAVEHRPIKIKNVKVTWDVINVELDGNLEFDLRLGIRRRRKSDLGTVQKWATFSKTGESKVAIPFYAYAGYDYEIVNADSQTQFTFNPSEEDLVEALWKDEDDQDIIKQAKKLISDGKKFDSSEKKIDDVYKLAEVSCSMFFVADRLVKKISGSNFEKLFQKVPEFGYIKLLGAKATDDLGKYDT